jgi:hypothetical protein
MMAKPSDPAPTETPTAFSVDLTVSGNKITGTIYPVGTAPPDVEQPPPDIEEPPPDIEQPPPDPIEPPPAATAPPPIPPIPGDAVYCGGREPADVLGEVPPGGTLVVEDGTYYRTFHTENQGIVIRSASGNPYHCVFDGRGGEGGGHPLEWHKGMIHANRSTTVIGIGFRNCGSPASGSDYSNEAGIWIGDVGGAEAKVLVQRCAFDGNANGIFCAHEDNTEVRIAESLFGYLAPNGQNASLNGQGGAAHDNYVAAGVVEVSHSYFWGCAGGHNVKSRSPRTSVHDNACMTQDGGRVFEAPDGGEASFARNTVFTRTDRQGVSYGNANMLAYCSENQNNGAGTLQMSDNVLHVSRMNSVIWAAAGSIRASGDSVHCYGDGSLKLEGNVSGIQGVPPSGSAPPLPAPPDWARP